MNALDKEIRVLYLVYWGALEPLGRSLVVPAVLRLANLGVRPSLITFEKAEDLANRPKMDELRKRFHEARVEWHPLAYHKTPKWPATAFDAAAAALTALILSLRDRFDVVHARTFVGGAMGLVIAKILGLRFVFHNEGFYAEEQIDAGVWKRDSRAARIGAWLEALLYRQSDGVIGLSLASVPTIVRQGGKSTRVVVSASAISSSFHPEANHVWRPGEPLRLCYLGSVGGRYRIDELMRFTKMVGTLVPIHLLVITRNDPALIKNAALQAGLPEQDYALTAAASADVPGMLARRHAGLHFLPRSLGSLGGSPTKVGEYWACGLPVAISSSMGDVDSAVQEHQLGVVVRADDSDSHLKGAHELLRIVKDPETGTRCRSAASDYYGLATSVDPQARLYADLLKEEVL